MMRNEGWTHYDWKRCDKCGQEMKGKRKYCESCATYVYQKIRQMKKAIGNSMLNCS
jgi:uncharacterized OB-fold protein